MKNIRTVRAEIELPTGDVPSHAAEVVVYVEDVSRGDAPSTVIGVKREQSVQLRPGALLQVSMDIPAALIDERSIYSARAHIDVSGSGNVKKGDLVSTETYPVLTRGHATTIRMKVRRV
jgi:uncharacterized lipoprotein YbaY